MFFTGILAGCAAAFFQDCGYVFSRLFVRHGGNPSVLLRSTQYWMGAAGLFLLPFLWFQYGIPFSPAMLPALLGSAYGSLFGQLFFFRAECSIDPARVSSMMGLRVILISLLTFLFFGERFHWLQITAVFLAALSAFVLNWQGTGFQTKGLKMMALSLLSYAVSDISIMHLVRGFGTRNLILSSLIAMALVNLLLALSVLPVSLLRKERPEWCKSAPFSGAWLAKQLLLYVCYGLIGPVFGNVIMSLRGPIAVALTFVLTKMGVSGLDDTGNVKARRRRLIAVLMMTLAIILYSLA